MGRKPLLLWSSLCLASLSLTGCWNDWCCRGDGSPTIKKDAPPVVPASPNPTTPGSPAGPGVNNTGDLYNRNDQTTGQRNNQFGNSEVKPANAQVGNEFTDHNARPANTPTNELSNDNARPTRTLNTNAYGTRADLPPGGRTNLNADPSNAVNPPPMTEKFERVPAMPPRSDEEVKSARPQLHLEDSPRGTKQQSSDKTPSKENDPVILDPQKINQPSDPPVAPAPPPVLDLPPEPVPTPPGKGTSQSKKFPPSRPGPIVGGVPVMPSGPSQASGQSDQ